MLRSSVALQGQFFVGRPSFASKDDGLTILSVNIVISYNVARRLLRHHQLHIESFLFPIYGIAFALAIVSSERP